MWFWRKFPAVIVIRRFRSPTDPLKICPLVHKQYLSELWLFQTIASSSNPLPLGVRCRDPRKTGGFVCRPECRARMWPDPREPAYLKSQISIPKKPREWPRKITSCLQDMKRNPRGSEAARGQRWRLIPTCNDPHQFIIPLKPLVLKQTESKAFSATHCSPRFVFHMLTPARARHLIDMDSFDSRHSW